MKMKFEANISEIGNYHKIVIRVYDNNSVYIFQDREGLLLNYEQSKALFEALVNIHGSGVQKLLYAKNGTN